MLVLVVMKVIVLMVMKVLVVGVGGDCVGGGEIKFPKAEQQVDVV